YVEPAAGELQGESIQLVGGSAREQSADALQRARYVGDAVVELAALGVALQRAPELGERSVRELQHLESQHERRGAVVRDVARGEAEVVVTRELAAEAGAGLAHDLFHIGVTDAAADRATAERLHGLAHGMRGAQVVEHGVAALGAEQFVLEDRAREQRR